MQFRCPNCNNAIHLLDSERGELKDEVVCPSCNSSFSMSVEVAETFVPGAGMTIAQFEILDILGEGAFGAVYRAWDHELERDVAIKIPRGANSQPAVLREARAAAAISHPNVVPVYEIGRHADFYYLVTKFINGPTLEEFASTQQIEVADVVSLMIKSLRAIHVFHEAKIIHRDLKPSNILLDDDRDPYIADFGLARRESNGQVTVTQSGRIVGTPAYMSPEQARGDTENISPLSDVFSMGVIFYELLTGTRPFKATNARTLLYSIRTEDPIPPRRIKKSIPKDVQTICQTALQKSQSERYSSAAEMADDLQRFADGLPITAKPLGLIRHAQKWIARNKALTAAVCTAVVAAAGIVYLAAFSLNPVNGQGQLKHEVHIKAELADEAIDAARIRWAFAHLDQQRLPIVDEIVFAEGTNDVSIDLAPGEYLIVVDVQGFGFQEVFRTVPDDEESASGSLTPNRFSWEEGHVELPDIRVAKISESTSGMEWIEGGEYTTGVIGNPFSPETVFELEDFYIERTEVTYGEFTRILPAPSIYSRQELSRDPDLPVVGMTWYAAVHYAEAMNRRLLTEIEWEVVATNRGESRYPWGDDRSLQPGWDLVNVNQPTIDKTVTTNVTHLFSNVAELTQSVLAPFPGGQINDTHAEIAQHGFVYRGGPSTSKEINQQGEWAGEVTHRMSEERRDNSADRLGFRCCRSAKPPFLEK